MYEQENGGHRRAPGAGVLRSAAACGSGFLIGILFWHLVGSYAPDARPGAKIGQGPPTDGAGRHTPCTALILDRITGRTMPAACDEGGAAGLLNVRSQKEDFGAAPLADASPYAETDEPRPSYRN